MEATPTGVSSIERISSQTIELSSMIHRRPIRVLLDSGSTNNYISDQIAQSFNLIIQSEEGGEQLTLMDRSKLQAQGDVSVRLWCCQYNGEVIAQVFPWNPVPKQENPSIY